MNASICSHHPSFELLLDYHQGRLGLGPSLVLETHIGHCRECQAQIKAFDQVGGALIDEADSLPMSDQALALSLARIERPAAPAAAQTKPALPPYLRDLNLPERLKHERFKSRYWGAPGVWIAPIDLGEDVVSKEMPIKTFLMHVAPGLTMPAHDHQGLEMTLVLQGGFSDDAGHYEVGDLAIRDEGEVHSPMIANNDNCLSLVSQYGSIKPKTLLGKLLMPFAKL